MEQVIDTLDFSKKTNLVNLKSDVNKLDFDSLKNVPSNLSNLKSILDQLDVDISLLFLLI